MLGLSKRILVLGGGFGGLTAATSLRARLGPENEIVVVDRNDSFFMGLAKLWVLTGQRTREEGKRSRTLLGKNGVKFVRAEVNKINIGERSVSTATGPLSYDYLVVALGADLAPDMIPGFWEAALNLYDLDQVLRINLELSGLTRGKLVILISNMPFKCPPAPYEAALLMDDMLRGREVRDDVQIDMYTAEPMPIPIAGPTNSAKLQGWLKERNIGLHTSHKPVRIEPEKKEVVFENGPSAGFDLLVGVPPHRCPKVVREAGLTDASGWVPVNPRTLKTVQDSVYAVGDVTAVKLPNGLMLPKAGIFAEAEANVVAEEIATEIEGGLSLAGFDGKGTCYTETGGGKATVVQGDFFASPSPKVELAEPSAQWLKEKHNFEEVRLRKWFGES